MIECESKYELAKMHPRRHLPQVRDLSRQENVLVIDKTLSPTNAAVSY
jgi:hypothetical protein